MAQKPKRSEPKAKPGAKAARAAAKAATHLIDERLRSLGGWRAEILAEVRRLIHETDPDIMEECKWIKPSNPLGVPGWSHAGIVCTGEPYKQVVKLTFARGASLADSRGLFNSSLDGNTRRAIDIREGEVLDAKAFKALIRAAVAENLRSSGPQSRGRGQTWIGLFRGINVGGNNILPMAKLKNDLEALELRNVRTYIQSGNVVFNSSAGTASSLSKKIVRRIEEKHGFRLHLLILSREELRAAIESNPFQMAVAHPKTLHFFFLAKPAADPDTKALANAKSPTENYKLTASVFYLHAPDGIGRSKLAANAEKYLGVVITSRNYRTVDKLLSMVTEACQKGGKVILDVA